jgi:hypothetical protein|nr:MAG TPA: hypothetical protein [Caudoviricetes sp.]
MIVKQKRLFRIVTVEAYNGCLPITAYMVQRLEKERTFLPDKWVNIKGFEDRKKAESLFELLT